MKIRLGFVSNSSSEAFLVGIDIPLSEIKKILEEMVKFHSYLFGANFKFEDIFEEPSMCTEEDREMLSDYGAYLPSKIEHPIIRSKNDNTIPWWMFELIEHKFDAIRYHLG